MKRTTIYALCDARIADPIMRVRYIGQTIHPLEVRLQRHWRSARFGNPEHRAVWMRAMARQGVEVTIITLLAVPSIEADASEMAEIARFRQMGCDLTNRTDGGKGHRGEVSEATRQKMRESAKRRDFTQEWRDKMRAGLKASDKVKRHMRAMHDTNRGRKRTPEMRERMSKARRGEACSQVVLSWDAVDAIRAKYASGIRQCDLVREYAVSPGTIHRVVHNTGWLRA